MDRQKTTLVRRSIAQAVQAKWTVLYPNPEMKSPWEIDLCSQPCEIVVTLHAIDGDEATLRIEHPPFVELKPMPGRPY